MVDVSNKKLSKNKSFFSKSKGVRGATYFAPQSKEIVCGTPILTLSKRTSFIIFSYPNKYTGISLFSKNDKILKDKTWFSDKKSLKWFTFLPFETPSLLFLPKMGTILFYSSSFSMINYF